MKTSEVAPAGILYDARWISLSGMGRFADEVSKRMETLTFYDGGRVPWHPADPALLSAMLWRLRPKLFFSPGYNAPISSPCPFVFTLHDLHHLRVPENSSAAKRAYYRHIIQPACHRAAFVLTVSEFSKQEIVDWTGVSADKVINVGNGIGPPFAAEGAKYEPGYPYLLYVGSRKPHKNLPRLLQAFAIAKLPKDARLILAGWEGPKFDSEIDRLGLSGRVICRRCDSDHELAGLYRGALGFVFPSLYEGFGIPPLEAMACGTPVVASNAAAIPEVLGDAGLMVDARNVDELAAAIQALVEDAGLRDRLREKGFARARKFTWDETARKVSLILETCTAGEPGTSGQKTHSTPAMKRKNVVAESRGRECLSRSSVLVEKGLKDLLIVIVNWNTANLLEKCLRSLAGGLEDLSVETVVVDNASTDGSAEMVAKDFPWVKLICNRENLGYARANNQALLRYSETAKYSLLLNPDTEVPAGTLQAMIDFMGGHPQSGAAGCKLVRPDGGLDWACRRGRLTPSMLFYKALGLDRMFPNSRRFGAYNLTYIDENRVCEVGAVVGAFMIIRRECLAVAGLLDDSYFMYAEDVDLCYRIRAHGWKVFYAPIATIIHHKGQATGKRSYTMIRYWYSSIWRLYQKHVAPTYPAVLNAVVWGGLRTMCAASLVANLLRTSKRVPSRR